MARIPLRPDDLQECERAFRALPDYAFSGRHFEDELELWMDFVEEVAVGYDGTMDEYADDLWGRDIIAETLSSVSGECRENVLSFLKDTDLRFSAATRPAHLPAAERLKPKEYWWWFRLPLKVEGDLLEDLRAHGLEQ